MAEWSIAAVLKTVVPRGTGGSNPSLSAVQSIGISDGFFIENIVHNFSGFRLWNEMMSAEKSIGYLE